MWGNVSWDVPDLSKLAESASQMAAEAAAAANSSMTAAKAAAEKSSLNSIFNLDTLQGDSVIVDGAIMPPADSEDVAAKPTTARSVSEPAPAPAAVSSSSTSKPPTPNDSVTMQQLREISEELRKEKLNFSSKDAECKKTGLLLEQAKQQLGLKQAECVKAQTELAEVSDSLKLEKKTVAQLKAEIVQLKTDKQSLAEKGEDDLQKANRKCADLQGELEGLRDKISSLQLNLSAVNAELASKKEIEHSGSSSGSSMDKSASSHAASPEPSAGSKGKGKGGKGGKGGQTPQPVVAEESPATKQLRAELGSAESKRSALEEQLEKLKNKLRETENANTTAERKAKREYEQIQDELATARSESESAIGKLNDRISKLSLEASEKSSELAKSAEANIKLKDEILQQKIALEKSFIDKASANDEKSQHAIVSAQSEAAEAKKNEAAKEAVVQELHGKLNGLTEKMKDLMKKYAEAKSKAQSLEESEGNNSAQTQKAMQTKDAELLSLRLKLENSECTASDQRAMASELADRFGDVQRELARSKTTVAEHVLQIEELQRELQAAVSATSGLAAEATSAQENVESEKNKVAQLQQEKKTILNEWSAKLAAATQSHDTKTAELRAQLEALQVRLASEDETAKALEEYKKRAQVALKKANATSSSMTSEIAEKQKQLDEALARLAELETLGSTTQHQMQQHADQMQQAENRVAELGHANEALTSEIASLKSTAHDTAEEHARKIAELQAALAAASTAAATIAIDAAESLLKKSEDKLFSGNLREEGGGGDLHRDDEGGNVCGATESTAKAGFSSASKSRSPQKLSKLQPAPSPLISAPTPTTLSCATHLHASEAGSVEDSVQIDDGITLQVRAPSADQLFYVNKLHAQIDELKRVVSSRGVDFENSQQELQLEREAKRKLSTRVEELLSYLDRTKKSGSDAESAVNMEYLKTCVYRFMASTELSEKKRLYPVISTILRLTTQEKTAIESAMATAESQEPINTLTNQISSWFG